MTRGMSAVDWVKLGSWLALVAAAVAIWSGVLWLLAHTIGRLP